MDNNCIGYDEGGFVVIPRMVVLGYEVPRYQQALEGFKQAGCDMRYPTKLLTLLLEHLLHSDVGIPNIEQSYSRWLINRLNGLTGETLDLPEVDVANIVIVALDALDGVGFRLKNNHLLYTPDGVRPLYRVHEVTTNGIIRLCLNDFIEDTWEAT